MKTVGTKLDESEYQIFDFCCDKNGLSKSEQLRDLIKCFVNRTDEDIEEEPLPRVEGRIIRVEPSEMTNITVSD